MLFLAARHLSPDEAVARDIASSGGSAEALDEQAVDTHVQSVIDKAGASTSRSTRSGSLARTFSECLWSS